MWSPICAPGVIRTDFSTALPHGAAARVSAQRCGCRCRCMRWAFSKGNGGGLEHHLLAEEATQDIHRVLGQRKNHIRYDCQLLHVAHRRSPTMARAPTVPTDFSPANVQRPVVPSKPAPDDALSGQRQDAVGIHGSARGLTDELPTHRMEIGAVRGALAFDREPFLIVLSLGADTQPTQPLFGQNRGKSQAGGSSPLCQGPEGAVQACAEEAGKQHICGCSREGACAAWHCCSCL